MDKVQFPWCPFPGFLMPSHLSSSWVDVLIRDFTARILDCILNGKMLKIGHSASVGVVLKKSPHIIISGFAILLKFISL